MSDSGLTLPTRTEAEALRDRMDAALKVAREASDNCRERGSESVGYIAFIAMGALTDIIRILDPHPQKETG